MIYGQLTDNSPVVPVAKEAPDAPTNFTYSINNKVLLITVDVPKSLTGSAKWDNFQLVSTELGYPDYNVLPATSVSNGKAYFKFFIDDFVPDQVSLQINTYKDGLVSSPLSKKVTIRKQPAITPTPKPTATSKNTPKATPKIIVPKAKKIKCSKAGVTREFEANTCPPGYTKK